jgi:hypothetical protein
LINHIVFCQLSAACTHCYEGKPHFSQVLGFANSLPYRIMPIEKGNPHFPDGISKVLSFFKSHLPIELKFYESIFILLQYRKVFQEYHDKKT